MLIVEPVLADGCTVVGFSGELEAATVVQLRESLAAISSAERIVVDLSTVTFMDSAGLGAMIGFMRRVRQAGGNVALACARPPLKRLLETAGIDRIVLVTDTVAGATAALGDDDLRSRSALALD